MLVTDMLQYGATAQRFFGYNTDFLATDAVAKIKVVNGTHADGFKTGYYKAGTSVTLIADEAGEGFIFSHWEDSNGNVVGSESTLMISECASETYTAVYRDATSAVQYRYRDKQYTTSTTELGTPWILYNSITEVEHGSTFKVYLEEDETIDTNKYCVHYKTSVCKYMHPTNSTYKWVNSSSSEHNYYYTYGDTKYWHYGDYYCYTVCNVSSKTTSTEYYYYSWGEWSGWSDSPVASSANREVEIRGVYAVTYDANGGTNAPVAQNKAMGESVVITSSIPSREGYTFKGWSSTSNGDVEYNSGDTYSADSNITLYAVWEANTYTITYNANGGENAPNAQTKTHGIDLTLSSLTPTRVGYTFKGWATTADGAVVYNVGNTYSINENTTLYAVWSINTYTITYNANGGENAPGTQTKTHGIDLILSSVVPTRVGYTFKGWATTADGAVTYNAGNTYSINENTTLYAVWEINTYTITYNANGGENAPGTQTKTHGIDLILSSVVPIREGYTFEGWSTSVNGTVIYNVGDICSANEDLTLYAVWKEAMAAIASGYCGDNLTWSLSEEGTLFIDGIGYMTDWGTTDYKNAPWYSYQSDIKSVIIGNGVKNIGDYTFSNYCIENITLGNNVTRIGKFG